MHTIDTTEIEFQSFRQLEHEYIGYQSLTDVPKACVYSEEQQNLMVSRGLIIRILKLKVKFLYQTIIVLPVL